MRITENSDRRITEDNNTRIEEFEEITYPSSINRVTVISFPLNDNREDITTGIEAGSLYLNKLLFQTQINYGESNSDRFEVALFDCDDISKETIQVYQLDYTEDEDNPVRTNLFYGVIDSCLSEDNGVNRRIVAYDLMYDLGNKDVTEWWNNFWSVSFTATVEQLLTSLLTEFDVTLNPNIDISEIATSQMVVTHFSGVQSITFGTVLAYIGQALMVNPHFNEEGQLDLVKLGANFNRSIFSIEGGYEDENSHFEDYTTEPVTRVAIYGETDVIAGEYGTGDNVYVVKNNPLLFNISGITYRELARIFYENLSGSGISYTPANIKMIVSKTGVKLGDIVKTPHGSSVVSAMELSGSMLVEQTIVSTGNQKLTPADFDLTGSQVGTALEQSTTTAKHFVWVDNDGAYVTTDNIGAGQAPTNNYSKLTDTGLYVASSGKEVAHFGVDNNNEPVSVLGSTEPGNTSVIMNARGLLASKQLTQDVSSKYFSVTVPDDTALYTNQEGTLVNSGNNHYLNLNTSDVFIGVSNVSYYRGFTVQGNVLLSLSHTRGGYDFIVEEVLDTLFENVPTPSGTYDSIYDIPLREWFNSWFSYTGTSTQSATIRMNLNMGFIIFRNANGSGSVAYVNAESVLIQVSVTATTSEYSSGYARKYLNTAHFNFSDNRVNITNFKYYTYTPQTAPSTITTTVGTGHATLRVISVILNWRASMLQGEVTYSSTVGLSVDTNKGINSVVLGDRNTVTTDSQLGVFVAGANNTVDNARVDDTLIGTYIIGNNNSVEHHEAVVIGCDNILEDKATYEYYNQNNVVIGYQNTITEPSASESFPTYNENNVFGTLNDVTGTQNTVIGRENVVNGATNFVCGTGLQVNPNTYNAIVMGKYNTPPSSGQFVVGSGSASSRSNAMSLSSAQMTIAGDLYFNGGSTGLTTQLANKQAKLTVGSNISISSNNVISATDTKPNSWREAGVTDITGTDYSAYDQNGGVSLASGSAKSVGTINLTAGVWIVEFTVSFTANSTGYRSIGLSGTKNDSSYGGVPNRVTTGNAGTQATVLSRTALLYPSTTTRYHIIAGHNVGSAITVYPRVRAIKLN